MKPMVLPEKHEPSASDGDAALQWLSASSDVFRGLNHSLSNRMLSLEMLSTVAERGEDVDDDLLAIVAGEAGRFRTLLKLYRVMESSDRTASEPALIGDILPDAIALFGYDSVLRDTRIALAPIGDLAPVLLQPSACVQSLLVALIAVARVIPREEQVGIVVRCSGDAEWVTVTVSTAAPVPELAQEGRELIAVPWLLRRTPSASAWERLSDGTVRAVVRLGTLSNVRRREREG